MENEELAAPPEFLHSPFNILHSGFRAGTRPAAPAGAARRGAPGRAHFGLSAAPFLLGLSELNWRAKEINILRPENEPLRSGEECFSMEQNLVSVSMVGARALLYVLFLLSILSVTVAIEKYVQYRRDNPLGPAFRGELVKLLEKSDVAGALKAVEGVRGANAAVLREGLSNFKEGPAAIEEIINGRTVLERGRLERRLIILGTIGNNAPFVGLLGTVMGIIKAFHDLSVTTTQGPAAVMAGISEALVATAVGLFVAIPAVVLFNWLKSRARALLDEAEANARILLAYAKRTQGEGNGGNRQQ
jgi:biopolymer transport protein ExbB/TolQ